MSNSQNVVEKPIEGAVTSSESLDRDLFHYEGTYKHCLEEGMTNEQWLKIKENYRSGRLYEQTVSIQEILRNFR